MYDKEFLNKHCDCGAPDCKPVEEVTTAAQELFITFILAAIGLIGWMVWG